MVLQICYILDWCSHTFSCVLRHIEDVRRTMFKLSKLWKSHVLVMFVHDPETARQSGRLSAQPDLIYNFSTD